MPNAHHPAPRRARSLRSPAVLVSLLTLALAGCGAGGLAPEGPASNAFLNKVQANCGKLSVGHQPINWLLSSNSADTTFVDATTKLYSGQFSQSDYASFIDSFYPTGTNESALDCIFDQL
jgi:hypothetical protein